MIDKCALLLYNQNIKGEYRQRLPSNGHDKNNRVSWQLRRLFFIIGYETDKQEYCTDCAIIVFLLFY